jgi:hypothetical protein
MQLAALVSPRIFADLKAEALAASLRATGMNRRKVKRLARRERRAVLASSRRAMAQLSAA